MRSRYHPVVGAGEAGLAIHECGAAIQHSDAIMLAFLFFFSRRSLAVIWRYLIRYAKNGGAIVSRAGWRTVAPGSIRIQVGHEFRRKLCSNFFPPILGLILRIEQLAHAHADQHRVLYAPGFGSDAEKAELNGKTLTVLFNICVHALRVMLEDSAVALRKLAGHPFRDCPEPKQALPLVQVEPGCLSPHHTGKPGDRGSRGRGLRQQL